MKLSGLFTFLLAVGLLSCKNKTVFSLKADTAGKSIAIQPFDDFDPAAIASVTHEISAIYNRRVIILPPVKITTLFNNQPANTYSADTILSSLAKLQTADIIEIIGLTHDPVFTMKEYKQYSYLDDKIFGMACQPGNTCIVSDYRFKTSNQVQYYQRLRNVVIHEVGHNLDLPHCPTNGCIMSAAMGKVDNLDGGLYNYCNKCNRKILP